AAGCSGGPFDGVRPHRVEVPLDTYSLTRLPRPADVPPRGSVTTTSPARVTTLRCLTTSTRNPAFSSLALAATYGPLTRGTTTFTGVADVVVGEALVV